MKRLLLTGGRVLDPATSIDGAYDVFVVGGRIASIKPSEKEPPVGEGFRDFRRNRQARETFSQASRTAAATLTKGIRLTRVECARLSRVAAQVLG